MHTNVSLFKGFSIGIMCKCMSCFHPSHTFIPACMCLYFYPNTCPCVCQSVLHFFLLFFYIYDAAVCRPVHRPSPECVQGRPSSKAGAGFFLWRSVYLLTSAARLPPSPPAYFFPSLPPVLSPWVSLSVVLNISSWFTNWFCVKLSMPWLIALAKTEAWC